MSRKAEREERAILKARGKFPPELLQWVTSGEQEITQEVNKLIDKILKDRRRRVEVFLTALARKYVERAVYFVGKMPEVDEELLRPERIRTMKNADLIRLLGVMAEQVDDAAEFLRNFVSDEVLMSEPAPSPASEFGGAKKVEVESVVSEEERNVAAEMSAESKQRVGSVLRKMLMAIDAAGAKVPPLQLPEGQAQQEDASKPDTPKKTKPRGARK